MYFNIFLNILLIFQLVDSKLFYIEVKNPLIGNEPPPGTVVPKPQFLNETSGKTLVIVQNKFNITDNLNIECDIIEDLKHRYTNIIFPPGFNFSNAESDDLLLTELNIQIHESNICPGYPASDMDESYQIHISKGVGYLTSKQLWGAIRGIETFSQLVYINNNNKLTINDSTYINDFPRFSHRGLLIDTSRHFIPLKVLKKQLDAMSYSKFNVFHWHIVDDQSFPFESLKYPNLTENGKYSSNHVYTQYDINELINHGRLRGIRIIPELDTPGHTESFGRSFPEFITPCWHNGKPFQSIYGVQGKAEILNPTIPELYPVLQNIFSEFKSVFKDEYIHLGNDEVYYSCWKSNPNISDWMRNENMTEYHDLEAYYSKKILEIARDLNYKTTVWQDVYDNGVRPDITTQIQIWKDSSITGGNKKWREYLYEITKDGYKAILSSPWYINFLNYGYEEWYKWYQVEPSRNWKGSDEQLKLLAGGEACLWGEYVDSNNIQSRLWPRASVIAERLWSDVSVNDPEEAKYRFDEMRCRLLRRGIQSSPISPNGYCGNYEANIDEIINHSIFNY